MLQVPFFICRYLLLNIQVPFSIRQQAIHGTVLFTPDLLTPHTAFPSLPATLPVYWNVSTHFFYPCAHSVVASSTRWHLNRRNLNTYRETRPPSWENGTWQVPSQLSHSAKWPWPRITSDPSLGWSVNKTRSGARTLTRTRMLGQCTCKCALKLIRQPENFSYNELCCHYWTYGKRYYHEWFPHIDISFAEDCATNIMTLNSSTSLVPGSPTHCCLRILSQICLIGHRWLT